MISFLSGIIECFTHFLVCLQRTGLGTNAELARAKSDIIASMKPVNEREISVFFSADTHSNMSWNFKPSQKEASTIAVECFTSCMVVLWK